MKIGVSKPQYKFLQASAGMLLFSSGLFHQHNHPETSHNQGKEGVGNPPQNLTSVVSKTLTKTTETIFLVG